MHNLSKTKVTIDVLLLISGMTVSPVNATPQVQSVASYFDSSWTVITSDEEGPTPGLGGQAFDAEYLLYKIEGSILYLGLQSGFDLIDGYQYFDTYSQDHYWAGDLALSFEGDAIVTSSDPIVMANSYEFGIDFGLRTADYNSYAVDATKSSVDGLVTGKDKSGVYRVGEGEWNTNMVNSFEDNSSPFAMNQQWSGTGTNPYLASLILNTAGQEDRSYYRAVAFDMTQLGLNLSNLTMDVHWTMSCGNDNINGRQQISVPEPSVLLLMLSGLICLVGRKNSR